MRRNSEMLDSLLPVVALVSSLGLVTALVYFASFANLHWQFPVLLDAASWSALCVLGAAVLRFFTPSHAILYFAAAVLVYLLAGIGLAQSAAAALLIISCYCYGRTALGLMYVGQTASGGSIHFLLVGLALHLAIFGILIHYQVNYRWVYFVIILLPILVLASCGRLPAYWNDLHTNIANQAKGTAPPYGVAVLSIILLGLSCRIVLIPTLGLDDNVLHLGMWSQLTHRHVYGFDVVTQVWEVAPFAVDLLHAIVSILAGEDARPALNLVFFIVLLRQLWVILGHFPVRAMDRHLILLLFVSTPLVGNMLVSLQTELFLAVLITSAVRLVLEMEGSWHSPDSAAILAVAAMCCATKLPGAYIGALLVLAAIIKLCHTAPLARPAFTFSSSMLVVSFISLLSIVAFNSYVTAWWITGNPFFPLYNAIFQSPFFAAVNFADVRWIKGFSFTNYVGAFFTTSNYFESRDFVAGFQYLFLLPVGLIALLRRTPLRKAIIVLLPLFGFGLVMFSVTQYWRYLFPVFPLAVVVIAGLLMYGPADNNRAASAARLAIAICIGLNFYFYPGISWLLNIAPGHAYTATERRTLIEQHAPVRAITMYLNTEAPGARVLYPPDTPLGATLDGQPVYPAWYSPATLARAEVLKTEAEVAAFLHTEAVEFVITSTAANREPGSPAWLLRNYLSHAAFPEYQTGDSILYRLVERGISYQPVFSLAQGTTTEGAKTQTGGAQPESALEAARRHSIVATQVPRELATLKLGAARSARFTARFSCASDAGGLNAQIRWNAGPAYERVVSCTAGAVEFSEAFPVPARATEATISAASWGTPEITVTSMTLEIN